MTIGGVVVSYQGKTGIACEYRRSAGFEPDASWVEIPVSGFPAGFNFQIPAPGTVFDAISSAAGTLAGIRSATAGILTPATSLAHVGTLFMGEVIPPEPSGAGGPTEFEVPVEDMYVVAIDKSNASDPEGTVRISLLDGRAFWNRGSLERTDYNLKDSDEAVFGETQNPATSLPWTLDEIVEDVLSDLPKSPALGAFPDRWALLTPTFQFRPHESAVEALREIIRQFPAKLALNRDGSVSFWEDGKGKVAEASAGSQVNTQDLPAADLEDLDGAGHEEQRAFNYPADEVLVTGERGSRVATIAIDCLEPVVLVDGKPENLFDATARFLREDEVTLAEERVKELERQRSEASPIEAITVTLRLGTAALQLEAARARLADIEARGLSAGNKAWLLRFLLRPSLFRNRRSLTARTLEILQRDGLRLWRIPGAETFNRHLLPILRRAETDGDGVRLLPALETFRWRLISVPVSGRMGTGVAPTTLDPNPLAVVQYFEARRLRADVQKRIELRITWKRFDASAALEDKIRGGASLEAIQAAFATALAASPRRSGADRQRILRALALKGGALGAGMQAVFRALDKEPGIVTSITRLTQISGLDNKAFVRNEAVAGFSLLLPALKADLIPAAELAGAYRAAIQAETAARAAIVDQRYTADLDVQFAEALLTIGESVKTNGNPGDANVSAAVAIVRRLVDRWVEHNRRVTGFEPLAEINRAPIEQVYAMAAHFVNDERLPDPTAVLEDPDLGTFRTSQPAGSLDQTFHPTLDGRQLVPRAVRAVFGTRLGPKRAGVAERARARALAGQTAGTGILGTDVTQAAARQEALLAVGTGILGQFIQQTATPGPRDLFDPLVQQQQQAPRQITAIPTSASRFAPAIARVSNPRFPWCEHDVPRDLFPPNEDFLAAQVSGEALGAYAKAFKRGGQRTSRVLPDLATTEDVVTVAAIPVARGEALVEAVVIRAPDLVELIKSDGSSNRRRLDADANNRAVEEFARRRDFVNGARLQYLRPRRVNTNGFVTAVSITTRPGLRGFRTLVVVGLESEPFIDASKARDPTNKRIPRIPGGPGATGAGVPDRVGTRGVQSTRA